MITGIIIGAFVVLYAVAVFVLHKVYCGLVAEKKAFSDQMAMDRNRFSDQMMMADETMTERYSNFISEMVALEDKKIAFENEKSTFESTSAQVNKRLTDQFNNNTRLMQQLAMQGAKNKKLLDTNDTVFKRNSTTLFHLKETSLKLYDGYENIIKMFDGDWTNVEERNRILNDIVVHRDLLFSYFMNTFAITPDQYRKSKEVIWGKHHGQAPFITDSSIN